MALPAAYNVFKRIQCPIDHLVMQSVDNSQVIRRVTAWDTCMITWLLPTSVVQRLAHPRYEVEGIADHMEHGQLGFLTFVASQNSVLDPSWSERFWEPKPQPSASIRMTVVDRVHWQRTLWAIRSYSGSTTWGKIPKHVFGMDLNDQTAVTIDAKYNEGNQQYDFYRLKIPHFKLDIGLEDSGVGVLHPTNPIVPGFQDNESALRILAMGRETNFRGYGGMVYRQPFWASPAHPNVAKMSADSTVDEFLKSEANVASLGPPVAAWVIRHVPEIKLYQVEAQVEDENEPHSASHYGDKSLSDRVQRKAMNRYFNFRDEVRDKAYSDIEGREIPR